MSDAQAANVDKKDAVEAGQTAADVEVGSVADVAKDELEAIAEVEYSPEEERAVLRKIDWNILPLLCWVYMIQFADKTSLNYASLMGIREDAHLDPASQQYSWVSSIFYAGYIAWEFPTTYLLRRLPLGKYTAVNILLWGAVLALHAASHSYAALLTVRFFLGACEATITPAFVLLTSIWYRADEQAQRMGFWLSSNGAALLLMGPIAYGLAGTSRSLSLLPPWETLFLALGLLTLVTGFAALRFMPDGLSSARFLSPREKSIAIARSARANCQTNDKDRAWCWHQCAEALRDIRTWLYVLFSLLMNIPNGGITTFGSIVIKSFGVNDRLALLLNMPTGAVDIAAKLFFPYISDKLLDRTGPAFICSLLPLLGGLLMLCIPLEQERARIGLLLGYYLIGAAGAAWALVMTLIANNTLGFTKRATVSGLQIVAYAAGNWIGPQTFRARDAPDYRVGKMVVALMYAAAAVTVLVIRVVNVVENRRRDRVSAEGGGEGGEHGEESAALQTADPTDFQQKNFRYFL